ncbi:MAG: hypothetical protein CMM01_25565 [Rhodopirellula sp.]|nr:hypothetical protein [Rhodopirellula sp.]
MLVKVKVFHEDDCHHAEFGCSLHAVPRIGVRGTDPFGSFQCDSGLSFALGSGVFRAPMNQAVSA